MPKTTSSVRKKAQRKASTSRSRVRSDSPAVGPAVNINQPHKRRAQEKGKDEEFKERTISARTFSHWKPISKSSQALLVQTVDSAIISVLSETSSVAYTDVQEVLNNLKKRILEKSRNLKAPTTKRPQFSTLETACQKLENEAVEASRQEELLSEMVEQMTGTVQEKEKILEELEKDGSKTGKEKSH